MAAVIGWHRRQEAVQSFTLFCLLDRAFVYNIVVVIVVLRN